MSDNILITHPHNKVIFVPSVTAVNAFISRLDGLLECSKVLTEHTYRWLRKYALPNKQWLTV